MTVVWARAVVVKMVKQADSGFILKLECTALNYGLDVGYEINGRMKDDAKIFA